MGDNWGFRNSLPKMDPQEVKEIDYLLAPVQKPNCSEAPSSEYLLPAKASEPILEYFKGLNKKIESDRKSFNKMESERKALLNGLSKTQLQSLYLASLPTPMNAAEQTVPQTLKPSLKRSRSRNIYEPRKLQRYMLNKSLKNTLAKRAKFSYTSVEGGIMKTLCTGDQVDNSTSQLYESDSSTKTPQTREHITYPSSQIYKLDTSFIKERMGEKAINLVKSSTETPQTRVQTTSPTTQPYKFDPGMERPQSREESTKISTSQPCKLERSIEASQIREQFREQYTKFNSQLSKKMKASANRGHSTNFSSQVYYLDPSMKTQIGKLKNRNYSLVLQQVDSADKPDDTSSGFQTPLPHSKTPIMNLKQMEGSQNFLVNTAVQNQTGLPSHQYTMMQDKTISVKGGVETNSQNQKIFTMPGEVPVIQSNHGKILVRQSNHGKILVRQSNPEGIIYAIPKQQESVDSATLGLPQHAIQYTHGNEQQPQLIYNLGGVVPQPQHVNLPANSGVIGYNINNGKTVSANSGVIGYNINNGKPVSANSGVIGYNINNGKPVYMQSSQGSLPDKRKNPDHPHYRAIALQQLAELKRKKNENKKSNQCEMPFCTKNSRGASGRCVAHGGGRRCKKCNIRSARSFSDFCSAHGGGNRCKFTNCSRGAVSGTNFCRRHRAGNVAV